MKKLFLLLCLAGFAMQAQTANFKGMIANDTIGELVITGINDNFKQVIPIDGNGHFSGFIDPEPSPGLFVLNYNRMAHYLYLSDSTNLTVTTEPVFNRPVFKGKGANENELLQKMQNDFFSIYNECIAYNVKYKKVSKKAEAKVASWYKEIRHSGFEAKAQLVLETAAGKLAETVTVELEKLHRIVTMAGNPAPPFAYKDVNNKMVNLSDFAGKYVLIDVWATWCAPCREEMPALQKIMESLKDKNIALVGISIDKPQYEKIWKKMVAEKALGGTQLISEGGWQSKFMADYGIHAVPTYIIIGPDGNVIDTNAEWPSRGLERQLKKLLRN